MSQIFDALHQSTADRSGNGAREFSAAKELLQVVERKSAVSTLVADSEVPVVTRELSTSSTSVKVDLPAHSKFVCFNDPESLAAEKFRFLATRLRHLQQKRSLKSLLITSSVASEGKSIVAANLACALAAGKQQVLLVEGDLRRPSLAKELGLEGTPGLSQSLRGGSNNLIHALDKSGVHVLLAGQSHTNPLEFMDADKLTALLGKVSSDFDWVVIDSPPILPLADTSIWMRLSDAVLFVTRPGVTSKKQLRRSIEAIEQSKLLGCVMNASSEATKNHYYSYYHPKSGGPQLSSTAPK